MKALETRADVEVPKLEGRGLAADANTVAAYLENTLGSENLEAFERICLESDRHLAEVSECHEMLAEAPAFRQGPEALPPLVEAVAARMEGRQAVATVAGDQQAGASHTGMPRQPLAPQGRGRTAPPGAAVEPPVIRLATEPSGESAPRTPRRGAKRSSPWLQVAAAVGLLGLAGGGLGIVLWWNPGVPDAAEESRLASAAETEVMPVAEQVGDVVEDADRPEASPEAERAQPQAADPPVAVVAAETTENGPTESGGDATKAAADEPLARVAAAPPPEPQPPLGVGPSVPMGDALAIAAPPAPSPDALLPPAQAPEPPENTSAGARPAGPIVPVVSAIGVLSRGPLVLVSEAAQPGGWQARLPGEPLTAGVQVLAAPASQPELDLGGVVVRLAAQSQIVLREPTSGRPDVDLEVVFGKAVVRRTTGDATVSLRAAGLQWQLSGPPAAALVEVTLGREAGGDPGADAFVRASVAAADGGLEWTPLDGSAVLASGEAGGRLPRATAALWSSENPAVIEMRPAGAERWQAFAAPPERLAATAVEALAAAVRGEGDVLAAARQQGSSRRVENREVAAATRALVGDYAAAVGILCDDAAGTRLGERRWRSFQQQVVPLALARGVHSAERFRQALRQHLGEAAGDQVFQLAVGVSDGQLAAGSDTALVAALDDPRLVVRRYAALRLDEIVEPSPRDRLRYRADVAADLRAEAVRWWAVQLEKGLIQRPKPGQLSGPDAG